MDVYIDIRDVVTYGTCAEYAQLIQCRRCCRARYAHFLPPRGPIHRVYPLDSSMRRMWMPTSPKKRQSVESSSCILRNYFAAVDYVRSPLARVYFALHHAWHSDLGGSVQVPGLECCCRCSCPRFVQGTACPFSKLVLSTVYADHEDGMSAQATGF
jgi:hypothetical protein